MTRSATVQCSTDTPQDATFLSTPQRNREKWEQQKADPSLHLIGKPAGKPHLDDDQRREIHALYWTRRASQSELSARYGVSRPTISKIVHNPAYQQQPEDCPGSPQPISGRSDAANLSSVTAQTPAALVPVGARDGNGGGE